MESIYILIPIALGLTTLALVVYFWSVNSGQFDDPDKDGQQILFNHDNKPDPIKHKKSEQSHD